MPDPDLPDRPRTFEELLSRPGSCRYITGDLHAEHEFCSEKAVTVQGRRLPYCAAHAARCYRSPPRKDP